MLDFIFDYTWVAMLVIVYIIWSVKSIRDIVHTKDIYKDSFDICFLDDGTVVWIVITLLGMFIVSLLHWIFGGAE